MIREDEIKEIGKFLKTHALKGELNALLDVDPDFMTDGNAVVVNVDGIYVPFYAESVRPKGEHTSLVKLIGIDSEEEARPFVNKIIYAIKSELAPFLDIDEEEMEDEGDFIGFRIIDESSGKEIGVIENLDTSTENILFIVRTCDGEDIYIPAVEAFIADIDENDKTIRMNLPEGLAELNSKQ